MIVSSIHVLKLLKQTNCLIEITIHLASENVVLLHFLSPYNKKITMK